MACPLLQLPAELRNEIWQLALVRDEPIRIFHPGMGARLEPALLATCKQIRNEAQDMLYSENTFEGHCSIEAIRSLPNKPTSLLRWLGKIGDKRARMIKRLVVTLFNGSSRRLDARSTRVRHFTARSALQLFESCGLKLEAIQIVGPRPDFVPYIGNAELMADAFETAKEELMAGAIESCQ